MKKILLLAILAISLFSCNKEDNLELAVNQQQEQQKNPDYYYNLFVNMTEDLPVDVIKHETLANKAGDHGDNWLEIAFFRNGYQNDFYANVRSEDYGSGCYYEVDEDLVTYTFLSATSQLHIETASSSKKYNLSVDLVNKYSNITFASSVNVLLALTDEGKLGTGQTPNQNQFNFSTDCSLYELVEEAGTQLSNEDGWYSIAWDDITWEYNEINYGDAVDTLYVNIFNGKASYGELYHLDSFFLERREQTSYNEDHFSNVSVSSSVLSLMFYPHRQTNPEFRTTIELQKSEGPNDDNYIAAIELWKQQTLFERFGNDFILPFNGVDHVLQANSSEIHIFNLTSSGCYEEIEFSSRDHRHEPSFGDNGLYAHYYPESTSSCGGTISLNVGGNINNYYLQSNAYEYTGNCDYNNIYSSITLTASTISITICP